jgi:hypothetical protein
MGYSSRTVLASNGVAYTLNIIVIASYTSYDMRTNSYLDLTRLSTALHNTIAKLSTGLNHV